MATNYSPDNLGDFSAKGLNFRGVGLAVTAGANSDTNLDYAMPEDRLISGGTLLAKGSKFGDHITFQVIDIDNILGYGANTVLNEFVTSWYMTDDSQQQVSLEIPYPAKVYQGLYIRLVYHNTNLLTSVQVCINYLMHKVLY